MKKRRPPEPPSDLPVGTKEGRLSAHANPALQRRSMRSVEKLMTAAEAVLGREGWAAFTINAVAAEAGISVGGIYRRFASKEQLLRAIKDQVLDRADADHKEIAATSKAKSLDDAIAHYVSRRIASLRSYSGIMRQIFEGQQRDLVMEERGRQSINVGIRVFRSVISPFRSEIGHPDPELAIDAAFYMIVGIVMRRVRSPISDLSFDHIDWSVLESEMTLAITLYLKATRPVKKSQARK
ncbi:MAG TPA: helix-turn-helix domain-containing protein [Hyphomonadaceae bacterium]|jgi:AcrR family transcriptional regulator|nr:helix-turn-helix domain-containing protein [Hyphomonadaceae bacterium]